MLIGVLLDIKRNMNEFSVIRCMRICLNFHSDYSLYKKGGKPIHKKVSPYFEGMF